MCIRDRNDLIVYKILSVLVDECWRYSKPKQCHFWAWLKRPIFGVHDSQGSAETLVRRGGITNYHLMAYSFSNISAKNYQHWLMCVEVIVWNVIVVFFETQCRMFLIANKWHCVISWLCQTNNSLYGWNEQTYWCHRYAWTRTLSGIRSRCLVHSCRQG